MINIDLANKTLYGMKLIPIHNAAGGRSVHYAMRFGGSGQRAVFAFNGKLANSVSFTKDEAINAWMSWGTQGFTLQIQDNEEGDQEQS